jgi:hypothetical protein
MFFIGVFTTMFQICKITIPIIISIKTRQILSNVWYVDTFIIIVDLMAMILGTIFYPYINYKLIDKNEDIFKKLRKYYIEKVDIN